MATRATCAAASRPASSWSSSARRALAMARSMGVEGTSRRHTSQRAAVPSTPFSWSPSDTGMISSTSMGWKAGTRSSAARAARTRAEPLGGGAPAPAMPSAARRLTETRPAARVILRRMAMSALTPAPTARRARSEGVLPSPSLATIHPTMAVPVEARTRATQPLSGSAAARWRGVSRRAPAAERGEPSTAAVSRPAAVPLDMRAVRTSSTMPTTAGLRECTAWWSRVARGAGGSPASCVVAAAIARRASLPPGRAYASASTEASWRSRRREVATQPRSSATASTRRTCAAVSITLAAGVAAVMSPRYESLSAVPRSIRKLSTWAATCAEGARVSRLLISAAMAGSSTTITGLDCETMHSAPSPVCASTKARPAATSSSTMYDTATREASGAISASSTEVAR
mmetsp:Transcript_54063/g.171551  ORF Transcript_54063/g.171551 Transcript_54063/m.171551 type:complete len:402 (+) Transcript_54063:387-1592(+)